MRKKILIILNTFLMAFCVNYLLFWQILDFFGKIYMNTDRNVIICATEVSLLIAIVFSVYYGFVIVSGHRSKFINWLNNNLSKIFLLYFIGNSCFLSINMASKVLWTKDEMMSLVSLEWSIFGTSITIFLVWNGLILNLLKKKKPKKPEKASMGSTFNYIAAKSYFYGSATMLFNTASLLSCNLAVLAVSTIIVYLWSAYDIIHYFVALLSLVVSLYTIVCLFKDIISSLNEEKMTLLEESKVSTEDIEKQNQIIKKHKQIQITIDVISQSETLSAEGKKQIINDLLREFWEEDNANDLEDNDKVGVN